MAKTYVIPNIHIQKMGISRDGRTAEELLAQAGDVMRERRPIPKQGIPAPSSTVQNQRDDITSLDNQFIRFAKEMYNKTGSNAYPGFMPIRKAMYSSPGLSHNGGGNVMMTPPQFYSPIHTPVNWQIPTKRREVYMWIISTHCDFMTQDLTFKNVKEIEYTPSAITEDTLTDGIVYENIDCEEIYGGSGELRSPVHFFERPCKNKRFIRIKTNGYYYTPEVSEEHCVYSIKGKELRKKVKNYGCKLYREGFRGNAPKRKFIESENWDINRVESQDIVVGDFLLTPIPQNKETSNIDKDLAWMIGLTIADGTLYEGPANFYFGNVKINIEKKSNNVINESFRILKHRYESAYKKDHTNSDRCVRVYTDEEKGYDDFSKFITGKLNTKKFTKEIRTLSKEQMLNVLGGYFDGDGSFDKNSNKLIANNISKDMADQLYFMLLMCGIACSLNKYPHYNNYEDEAQGKSYSHSSEWVYRLFIPSSEVHKLRPYMKSDKIPEDFEYEGHDRVLGFFTKDEDGVEYYARSVQSVEEFEYTGIGYDIQIDPERSYVASGFKVSNCRFFANNNATINASLRFYSEFPFTDYEHVMTNTVRKDHFDQLKERLKIQQLIPQIAWEFFTMGDAFPFVSIDCPSCGGWGAKKDGTPCYHENGRIGAITVLNPDLVDVKGSPINPNIKIVSLVPDETLISIVNSKQPKEIYDMIPDNIKRMIIAKQPIPLSPNSIYHLKHRDVPYITYGMSLLAPLFPILAYLDRLRQAQWIVAERHILPIKICKVGNDQRPAGPQDIADVRSQLAATANDPNLTLVVHHAFDFDWVGAAGKVLQLTKEYELVDKEIIKGLGVNEALLSGQGPSYCFPQSSRILTSDGFKNLEEFDQEKHLVATLNPDTHKFEWGKATHTHVFDHDSIDGDDEPLVHFKNTKINNIFTKNHEMYVKSANEKTYTKKIASSIKHKDRFILKTKGWEGVVPDNIKELTLGIDLDVFLQLSAYFISEGSSLKEYNRLEKTGQTYICPETGRARTDRKKIGISLVQSQESDIIDSFFELKDKIKKYDFTIHEWLTEREEKTNVYCFRLNSVKLADKFYEYFGEYSENKKIPSWIKDLPSEYLIRFINHLTKCDGCERFANKKTKSGNYITYSTTSKKLNEDIFEILIKSGQSPTMSSDDPNRYKKYKNKAFMRYGVQWSPDSSVGDYPVIRNAGQKIGISEAPYKGKVWCVTVPPNNLILVERNGQAIWTGNSQAAIGIEATIKRLRNVQALFSRWIIDYIYKPEARMKGFYRQTKSGEKELDVPDIRWNDLNLRDETQKQNQTISLWEKQAVSTQTLHEKLGLDYDVEVERIRMEQQYQLQMGIAPQGGKKGGLGGLGGGLGGGFGGGFGGGGGMGGNLPGGQSGPGLPGDEMAPSMSGGEGAGGGPSGGGAMEASDIQLQIQSYEEAKKVKPKVHRPRKYRLTEPKIPRAKPQMVDQPELYEGRTGAVNLTELERMLYSAIERGQAANQLPQNFVWQQQPEPVKFPRIVVDGLFPDAKLIVQADGEQWHSSPKDIEKDQEIDARLASCGWTVLRFTEEELKTNIDAILAKIIQTYKELKSPKTANRTFSFEEMMKIASHDYIQSEFGRVLYSQNRKEVYSPEKNLVERISKLAHDQFVDSMFDYETEDTPTIKVASKVLGEEVDLITTDYSELPEDVQNEYAKLSILALDDICVAMQDGIEIDSKLHESIARDLYKADGGDRDWNDLDDYERSRYLIYPKKASEIIFKKEAKEDDLLNIENNVEDKSSEE